MIGTRNFIKPIQKKDCLSICDSCFQERRGLPIDVPQIVADRARPPINCSQLNEDRKLAREYFTLQQSSQGDVSAESSLPPRAPPVLRQSAVRAIHV